MAAAVVVILVWRLAVRRWCRAAFQASVQLLAVVVEAEVDESAEVERGDAGGEPLLVAFDAAVADAAVAVGDEPGDGSFDHGSLLAVVGSAKSPSRQARRASTSSASWAWIVECPAVVVRSCSVPRSGQPRQWRSKLALPLAVMVHGVAGGAGRGAGAVVDDEVVAVEPAGDRRVAAGSALITASCSRAAQLDADLAGAVGGVGEDLQARLLAGRAARRRWDRRRRWPG